MQFSDNRPPPQKLPERLTVSRLREWVRNAQPRARLIYASGPSCRASCGPLVADEVARLSDGLLDDRGKRQPGLGLVTANFARGPDGEGIYVVTRSAKPLGRGVVL
jgi:hypothetical protein